ncbi:unnamed protein product [Heligmosomoides polygyrus]|uniref:RPOL4c domain-containing protein n=1 Tax=Heligmosomoides polygyrus TaxID=6339 RepID=A0A183GC61_HELPZ|nr:unnamed protein product [Heligmosomoides polygyrus]
MHLLSKYSSVKVHLVGYRSRAADACSAISAAKLRASKAAATSSGDLASQSDSGPKDPRPALSSPPLPLPARHYTATAIATVIANPTAGSPPSLYPQTAVILTCLGHELRAPVVNTMDKDIEVREPGAERLFAVRDVVSDIQTLQETTSSRTRVANEEDKMEKEAVGKGTMEVSRTPISAGEQEQESHGFERGTASGAPCEQLWRQPLRILENAAHANQTGKPKENFKEFLRKFRSKYSPLGRTDAALTEILRENHLDGRARSVFLAIPEEVVEQVFEAVISEMERVLANDPTAARM